MMLANRTASAAARRADFLEALEHAGQTPAAKRAVRRIQAAIAREEIVEVLALHENAGDREVIGAWVESLDDDQLLDRMQRLVKSAVRNHLRAVDAAARALLAESIQAVEQVG